MAPDISSGPDASEASAADVPNDLAEALSRLDESELRTVISYARSLLPRTPTVKELLEEGEGEEILEVEEQDGYTKVVKRQPCADGCEECPHGPYLYHVRVEKYPETDGKASLHWEFIGPVQ